MSVVRCQVEVSATVRSLVQRSPTKCGVSECDLETLITKPRPTGAGQEPVKLFASCVLVPLVLPAGVSGYLVWQARIGVHL